METGWLKLGELLGAYWKQCLCLVHKYVKMTHVHKVFILQHVKVHCKFLGAKFKEQKIQRTFEVWLVEELSI